MLYAALRSIALAIVVGLGAAWLPPAAPARAHHQSEHLPDAVLQLRTHRLRVVNFEKIDDAEWARFEIQIKRYNQECGTDPAEGCESGPIEIWVNEDYEGVELSVQDVGARVAVYPEDRIGVWVKMTIAGKSDGLAYATADRSDGWKAGRALQADPHWITPDDDVGSVLIEYDMQRVEPDLAIEELWTTPDPIVPGQDPQVCARVRNVGIGWASEFSLVLDIGGVPNLGYVSGLDVDRSEERCASASLPPGEFAATARANATYPYAVPEPNKANNAASMTIRVPGPDLVVVSLRLPDVQRRGLAPGHPYRMCAEVGNAGQLPAGPSRIDFIGGIATASAELPALLAGQSREGCAEVTMPPSPDGSLLGVSARADAGAAVMESAEDNNEYLIFFEIMPILQVVQPNISVAQLDVQAGEILFGGRPADLCVTAEVEQAAAGPFAIRLLVDGQLRGEGRSPGQLGSSTATHCFPVTEPTGEHQVLAVVDTNNEVEESDEGDNALTQTLTWLPLPNVRSDIPGPFTVDLPRPLTLDLPVRPAGQYADLVVNSVEVEDNDCDPGRNRILAVVRNAGAAKADRFIVRLWVDGQEQESETIEDLDSGEEKRVRFSRVPLDAGSRHIRVQADAGQHVDEANESNNEGVATVNCVVPRPDLVVSSIEVEDNDCDPGRNQITAVIRNQGDGRARRFEVRLWVDGQERGHETIDELDPNDDKRARFSRIELGQGSHQLRVKADAGQELDESNEGNNERTATVNCVQESRS